MVRGRCCKQWRLFWLGGGWLADSGLKVGGCRCRSGCEGQVVRVQWRPHWVANDSWALPCAAAKQCKVPFGLICWFWGFGLDVFQHLTLHIAEGLTLYCVVTMASALILFVQGCYCLVFDIGRPACRLGSARHK